MSGGARIDGLWDEEDGAYGKRRWGCIRDQADSVDKRSTGESSNSYGMAPSRAAPSGGTDSNAATAGRGLLHMSEDRTLEG